jgi:hypothetical protein
MERNATRTGIIIAFCAALAVCIAGSMPIWRETPSRFLIRMEYSRRMGVEHDYVSESEPLTLWEVLRWPLVGASDDINPFLEQKIHLINIAQLALVVAVSFGLGRVVCWWLWEREPLP